MNYILATIEKAITSSSGNYKPKTVLTFALLITWLVLLIPAYSLLTYTSTTTVVLQHYSLTYTAGLAVYLSVLGFWPLLILVVPEYSIDNFSKRIRSLYSNQDAYIRFISIYLFITTLIYLVMRLYSWGYNQVLQLSILAIGVWITLLPAFWEWGISGLSLRWLRSGRMYDWFVNNISVWIGPLVVITAIPISATLAYIVKPSKLPLLLLPLPAIGIVILFSEKPLWGLIALIFTIALPVNGPSGLNATMVIVALLFGLWLAKMLLNERELKFVASLPMKPLLALNIGAILSFGFGQLPWYTFAQSAPLGAQLGGLSIYLLSACTFLLMANQVRDLRWLQIVTWVYIGVAVIYIVDQTIWLNIFDKFYIGTGSLFWLWLVALAFSQAVFNKKLPLFWRLVLIGIIAITFYVAYVQRNDWKSGWVPAVVSIMVMIGIHYWRFAIFVAPFSVIPLSYVATQLIANDQYSWGTRVDAWLIVVEITKASPILGLGFANYRWFTPLFPIRGWAVQFNSHSQFVDLFAQTGIVGFLTFIWFFAAVGWLGWTLLNRVPEGFAKAYVYGALGGVVASMVAAFLGDWVLPFFYNVGLTGFRGSFLSWLFLGGLVAIEQITKQNMAQESE